VKNLQNSRSTFTYLHHGTLLSSVFIQGFSASCKKKLDRQRSFALNAGRKRYNHYKYSFVFALPSQKIIPRSRPLEKGDCHAKQ